MAHDGGPSEETLFINVTCWEKLADTVSERLRKGDKVVVLGRLKPEAWTAADGSKRSAISIRAISVEFMSTPRSAAIEDAAEQGEVPRALDSEREPTGLPF